MIKHALLLAMFSAALLIGHTPAKAQTCLSPACEYTDLDNPASFFPDSSAYEGAVQVIENDHDDARDKIVNTIVESFHYFRDFMGGVLFKEHIMQAMQMMTQNLSSAMMHEAFVVGTFFDAKQQLESRRNFETLKFEAHKDYQPSQGFCSIGTNARSLVASDLSAEQNKLALNRQATLRILGNTSMGGAVSGGLDRKSRWDRFTKTFCSITDNGFGGKGKMAAGLRGVCAADIEPENINADVNYSEMIEKSRTLNVDFTNNSLEDDEKNVIALGQNLYAHAPFDRSDLSFLQDREQIHRYFPLRSILAKRNVARASFDAQVALKSAMPAAQGADDETYSYLAAALKDLGMEDNDILELIGENPSYFAQLEVLSKRLYQSPNFIAALYDSPTNVKRKAAALTAINLMLDRAIYESELRQETLLSVLLTTDLRDEFIFSKGQAGKKQ